MLSDTQRPGAKQHKSKKVGLEPMKTEKKLETSFLETTDRQGIRHFVDFVSFDGSVFFLTITSDVCIHPVDVDLMHRMEVR